MSRYSRLLPWLALFTIYVVWGSTYLAIAIAVKEVPPFFAAFLRFLVAGAVMAALAYALDPRDRRPTRRDWVDYSLIGVLFLGFGNGLVMWSEQRVPSGIAALVVATVPLWTTLLDGLRPGGVPWTSPLGRMTRRCTSYPSYTGPVPPQAAAWATVGSRRAFLNSSSGALRGTAAWTTTIRSGATVIAGDLPSATSLSRLSSETYFTWVSVRWAFGSNIPPGPP